MPLAGACVVALLSAQAAPKWRWDREAATLREALSHAWRGYEAHAWGADELLPVSNSSRNNWGGLAISMIDALDTLLLLKLQPEYERAVEWLKRELPAKLEVGPDVNFFETSIRALGGLLGAFTLTGDRSLLALAEQIGRALLPAFNSPRGLPYCGVNLRTGDASCPLSDFGEAIPIAEAGSVQLEFEG